MLNLHQIIRRAVDDADTHLADCPAEEREEMATAVEQALLAAGWAEPEPWEYVAHITGWADTTITSDTPMPEMQATHRRRKAGPWEPVTEPHLADGTLHGSLS